jgi:hypothetical protein
LLKIEAKTNHTDEPPHHYGNDFQYYGGIFFGNDIACGRVHLDKPIDGFVEDATKYEMYMNDP